MSRIQGPPLQSPPQYAFARMKHFTHGPRIFIGELIVEVQWDIQFYYTRNREMREHLVISSEIYSFFDFCPISFILHNF